MARKTSVFGGFQTEVIESARISVERDMPSLFIGETGTGKTMLIRELAKEHGTELIRINLTGQTTVDEILGKYLADPEKGTYWIDGLLTRAMREGLWVVLDEINMMLPEITARLHSLLDDDKMIVLTEKDGEIVRPHKNFRLFATINPSGEYGGTKELNRAFMSRFPIVSEVFASHKEAEILKERTDADLTTVRTVVKFIKEVRKAKKEDKITFYPSTRDAISACELVKAGIPLGRAVYMSIIQKAPKEEQKVLAEFATIIDQGMKIAEAVVETDIFDEYEKLKAKSQELEASLLSEKTEKEKIQAEYDKIMKAIKGVTI